MDIEWVKEILIDVDKNRKYLSEHLGENRMEDKLRVEMIIFDLERLKEMLDDKR